MRIAIEQSARARESGDLPFGAVITRKDQIVIAAENREALNGDVTAHAETNAIASASRILGRRDLSDCTIYSSAEPCPMCSAAIFQTNIPRVVYGLSRDDLPNIFRRRKIRIHHLADDWDYRPELVGGVLREQAMVYFDDLELPLRVVPKFHPRHIKRRQHYSPDGIIK